MKDYFIQNLQHLINYYPEFFFFIDLYQNYFIFREENSKSHHKKYMLKEIFTDFSGYIFIIYF